jgi:hypothetical protein
MFDVVTWLGQSSLLVNICIFEPLSDTKDESELTLD